MYLSFCRVNCECVSTRVRCLVLMRLQDKYVAWRMVGYYSYNHTIPKYLSFLLLYYIDCNCNRENVHLNINVFIDSYNH